MPGLSVISRSLQMANIPALVMKLLVTKGAVRAVVIVEYTNIGRDLSWVRENFNDVVIISIIADPYVWPR